MITIRMTNNTEAEIHGSPIKFRITDLFASYCLCQIGTTVRHDILGPLFCDEIFVGRNGLVEKVVFFGTSNPHQLRHMRLV